MAIRRLILRSFQSPGDVAVMTAAVRDLHLAHQGHFETDVRTSADALWLNNPFITRLNEGQPGVESIDMHYPLIHESNQLPYHFLHGYPQYLEQRLGVKIPLTRFSGDIHLSPDEKNSPPPGADLGVGEHFWIILAGGKFDFTAKWYDPASYQRVVDHFRGKIQFVQCGEQGHWHPPLEGVINLVGKTDTRSFIRLMHHADGVLCPVTFAMHLAAAVETRPGRPKHRACVVIAGGREPTHWEAYPHHQYISTVGALPCCADGGCWKSRCQAVGDGDVKDRHDLCVDPVQVRPDLRIPRCLDMITPEHVIERIEFYYKGGALQYRSGATNENGDASRVAELARVQTVGERRTPEPTRSQEPVGNLNSGEFSYHKSEIPIPKSKIPFPSSAPPPVSRGTISLRFHHGLGDCAYFAHLIPLYTRRGYHVQVECTPDKAIMFEAAGAEVIASGAQHEHPWGYPSGSTHAGHGNFWQGSKITNNLSAHPLPHIGSPQELWDELCAATIDIVPRLPQATTERVERWLSRLPRPVILLHTKGNTGQERKSLPDAITAEFYKALLDRFDGSLVLLDWDNRVPRLASYRVRHLDELGACPLDVMLALMVQSDLMIGVDSGPLHACRFTQTPSVGIWMPGHYPATYTLPRPQQLNIVLADHTRQWNRYKRIPWNIVEHPGAVFQPDLLAQLCVKMLQPPRYLAAPVEAASCRLPAQIAADVQFQHFLQCCRGTTVNALSAFADRHRSFDVLFSEISRRFTVEKGDCPSPTSSPFYSPPSPLSPQARPVIVETGTIRSEEDWPGAGFFTYLAGAYISRRGGKLHSVDLSPGNCEFAREWTRVFGDAVSVHTADSIKFLESFSDPIDVLYLDSLDTTEPGHAEHAERELAAAWPRLHERSLIVVDDTPWHAGAWVGKGARVVPLLLEQGWKILYAGYQVVLGKETQ